jgi:hypothetical protein
MLFNFSKRAVKGQKGKYLFCYFVGNKPHEERVHFAVSADGYSFTPLNGNKPVITQTLGTGCVRDPFVFRGRDRFYIIGTDMKSANGWASNHAMIVWESKDLITWENERILDMRIFDVTKHADRVWAPQVLWDDKKDSYFVYWSNHNSEGGDKNTVIWCAYTDDFYSFKTTPRVLFRPKSGMDGIDADIIEKGGKYYMYYKDEHQKTICYAVADSLDGIYIEPEKNNITLIKRNVEGNCMYPLVGTDYHIMIMDRYSDGKYFMQQTKDMVNFEKVMSCQYKLDFSPRHGSVMVISEQEYDTLRRGYE